MNREGRRECCVCASTSTWSGPQGLARALQLTSSRGRLHPRKRLCSLNREDSSDRTLWQEHVPGGDVQTKRSEATALRSYA